MPCCSHLEADMVVYDRSCSVLFTDLSAGEWDAGSQLAPGTDAAADDMGVRTQSCACVPCPCTIPCCHLLFSCAVTQRRRWRCVMESSRGSLVAEVPPERAVPNPQQLPAPQPRWYPRGPARLTGKRGRGRYLPRFYPVVRKIPCENAVPEIDGAPVDEAAFQEGSSRAMPVSREHTEDTHAAGAAGEGRAESSMADGERLLPSRCTHISRRRELCPSEKEAA
ncbi:uncharacterized protein LOC110387130 isoform X1 [Numida meleagris]|uniref:uncharacterized protein LOC110387130 isoform X1 n=1 Tax=Numida meleagris TaxID=8996 RepID=UPI000B3E18AF|nr:uncharacterized protein LOC110387130 isoform X1 [Numida meleagris]